MADEAPRDLPRWLFGALAVALPALLLPVHRDLGHHGDMGFFFDWLRAVQESPAFYRDGPGVNYPVVGVALVAGPTWLLEALTGRELDYDGFRLVHKATMALFEVALILLAAPLARALGVPRPRAVALALFLLPCSWAQGAWFGQIDVALTALLLVPALASVRAAEGRPGWLVVAALALVLAALGKQLAWFSLPWLGLTAVAAWQGLGRRPGLAVACLATAALLVLFDPLLLLPEGYRSHLAWIALGGGSSHGNVLSGSGANLWSLLTDNPSASSLEPWWPGVSARTWGLLLFGAAWAVVLAWWLTRWRRLGAREAVLDGVLAAGVGNLAMACLLTGVHERYLVHGAAFLALGVGRLGSRPLTVFTWIVCGWSGLYVLGSLHWDAFGSWWAVPFRTHYTFGPLQLLLLAWLLGFFIARTARPAGRRPGQKTPASASPAPARAAQGTGRSATRREPGGSP